MRPFRLLLGPVATRGRLLAVGAGGALIVLLATAITLGGGSPRDARDLVDDAGMALLLPVIGAVFGTAVLGEHVEDGTLGYLWLTPWPRQRLAAVAWAVAVTVAWPLVAVPLAVAALVGGAGTRFALAAVLTALLGVAAYGALFTALGVALRRALVWGLLYAVFWEGTLASVSDTLAVLSLRRYTRGTLAAIAGRSSGVEPVTAVTTLVAVTLVGIGVAGWVLRRRQLD